MPTLPGFENSAVAEPIDFGVGTALDERRVASRLFRPVPLMLNLMSAKPPVACQAEDISECGLYLRVPADYGLSVGQRCELSFGTDPHADVPPTLMGETCYATVVRTEHLVDANQPVVGAGLRFDQPIYL